MPKAFNPPPSWPEPNPRESVTEQGFTPPPHLPEPPAGWHLFAEDVSSPTPVAKASDLEASEIRQQVPAAYPVSVIEPGVLHTHGAPETRRTPAPTRRYSSLVLYILGLVVIAASIALMWWLYTYVSANLPDGSEPQAAAVVIRVLRP